MTRPGGSRWLWQADSWSNAGLVTHALAKFIPSSQGRCVPSRSREMEVKE
jgi:hypothetical protein